MIEQAKRFVKFPGPGINQGERLGGLRSIKGVFCDLSRARERGGPVSFTVVFDDPGKF